MALLLLSPLKRYRFINDLTKAPVTSDFFFSSPHREICQFRAVAPRARAYIRACKHRGKRSRERIGSETTFSNANWHPVRIFFPRSNVRARLRYTFQQEKKHRFDIAFPSSNHLEQLIGNSTLPQLVLPFFQDN